MTNSALTRPSGNHLQSRRKARISGRMLSRTGNENQNNRNIFKSHNFNQSGHLRVGCQKHVTFVGEILSAGKKSQLFAHAPKKIEEILVVTYG